MPYTLEIVLGFVDAHCIVADRNPTLDPQPVPALPYAASAPERSWTVARQAVRLLTRPGPGRAPSPSPGTDSIIPWIMLTSVSIGLAWMTIFRVTALVFRDPEFTQVRALHALAVIALECLFTGTGLILGLANATASRTVSQNAGRAAPPRSDASLIAHHASLVIMLIVLTYWVLIDTLPSTLGWYPPRVDPRSYLNPLYPLVSLRPLLLAPIWSRWSLLLCAGVGRAAPEADPVVRSLCAAVRPTRVLRWMLVPLVPTVAYTLRQQRVFGGFVVVLLVLLITYLAAVVFARRHGGQTRETLQGCAAIAQIVFLAAYRALCA